MTEATGTTGTGRPRPDPRLCFPLATLRSIARPTPLPRPHDWRDLDGWRLCLREARFVGPKRGVVAAWAAAAGAVVSVGRLWVPKDLPNCLALAEMKTTARCVGLGVEEHARKCAWCPNDALADDQLCEHCRWLAGPGVVP